MEQQNKLLVILVGTLMLLVVIVDTKTVIIKHVKLLLVTITTIS